VAKKIYTLEQVKDDIKGFFANDSHRLFAYGTPTPDCNKNCPFHKRNLQVLFEDDYPHDITIKAVKALVREGFLKLRKVPIDSTEVHFLHRYNLRYVVRLMKHLTSLIRQYGDYRISKATGDYAEMLFGFMFRLNGFEIVARNVSEYNGTNWVKTQYYDLDFIIERDAIVYGVEIKNTFDYMPPVEFQAKLEICKRFDIVPVFPLRCPSDRQFEDMRNEGGLALKFKARIFPPGQEQLVHDIWNFMRLPVTIWKELPRGIEKRFIDFHNEQLAARKTKPRQ